MADYLRSTCCNGRLGFSSKLRRGFVPLMNLQWDSSESPFTCMHAALPTTDDCSAAVIAGNAWELTSATVVGVVDEVGKISLVPAPTA